MERCDVAFSSTDRSYGPETISVMTSAFDMVCKSVSMRMKGSDDVKKTLALIILRHVDRGECNAERLAETAFRESTGTDRLTVPRQLGPCPPAPPPHPIALRGLCNIAHIVRGYRRKD